MIDSLKKNDHIISTPERFIAVYDEKIKVLRDNFAACAKCDSRRLYINFLKDYLLANMFGNEETSLVPGLGLTHNLNFSRSKSISLRHEGTDWPLFGITMVGELRLNNIWTLLKTVFEDKVPGDYMETGSC